MICSEKKLRKLCRTWQKRLRLQDWDVRVSIQRTAAFGDCGVEGKCERCDQDRVAVIGVLHPEDHLQRRATGEWLSTRQDMEVVLVHELLHLTLADWSTPSYPAVEWVAKEVAIQRTAEALVAGYRRRA